MAFLDATVLNDFQASEATNEKFDANYGMLRLASDSTPYVDYVPPSVKELLTKSSASRNALIPVLKDQTVTVSATPGFDQIPVNLGETGTYYFTAYDVFSGFRLYPAAFENNMLGDAAWYRDQILRNVLKACAVSADDIVETVLETRKTQVLNYVTQVSQNDGTFTFGSSTLTINKAAQKEVMFPMLNQLMIANQLPGNYRIVTSPGGLISGETEAMKYGQQNDKNIKWAQAAMSPDRRYVSDQITTSANFNGFYVRDGGIGVQENYPYDFRKGTSFAGKKWSISDVKLPYMNMRANVFVNVEATEATSIVSPNTDTNLTMTHWEEMALWFRFYVMYRYNSDLTARQNDVVKLIGATS